MKRIPFGYDRTKTENVVKLRNILSTLFTSGDKDRRPCSDPARPASSRSVGATRRSFRRGETAGQKSEARTVENVRVGNNIVRSIFAAWGDGTDAGGKISRKRCVCVENANNGRRKREHLIFEFVKQLR